MQTALTDSEYRRFRDWLNEEFGLFFGPEKRDILRSRLDPARVEHGFDTFEQLFFHLKFHPDRERNIQTLIPKLTNNESYFFRETGQVDVLRDVVIPSLIPELKARKRHEVRILSAGCAAGEEAYTLAMTLRVAGALPPNWKLRLRGIDLDPEVLDRARAGVYRPPAFRRIEEDMQKRFFTEQPDGLWKIQDGIREMVQFSQANLASDAWVARLPKQDVVFCRNVLIYFDDESTRRVVDRFYEVLEPGGFLFLGHAESLSRIPSRFEAVRQPGALYYRKPLQADE